MIRNVSKAAFWVLVIGLGTNLVLTWTTQRVKAAATEPTPYTVELAEEASNAAGKVTHVTRVTHAVRSDGSTLLKASNNLETFRLLEFSSKIRAEIKERREIRSIQTSKHLPLLRDPANLCAISPENVLGEETISGYRTAKVGKDARTSWYALGYGCALVREVMKFDTGEVSEKRLLFLTKGEPDPALFHVPVSYKEVPPSMIVDPDGKPCASCKTNLRQQFAMRDKSYYENRPTAMPQ